MKTFLSVDSQKTKELLAQGHKVYHLLPMKTFLKSFIVASGLASSLSEAKRLLKAGAIEIDGKRVEPDDKFFWLGMNEIPASTSP